MQFLEGQGHRAFVKAIAAWVVLAAATSSLSAADVAPLRLETNEAHISALAGSPAIPLDDPLAVFGAVFAALPDRVKVRPTENYYYVEFLAGGVAYTGNIRLAAIDRDAGKLHFAYAERMSEWRRDTDAIQATLDETHDVTVSKRGRFLYAVTHRGKTVTFELEDLSDVRPPADALAPGEAFVGPVFDESGLRFFLVFDRAAKVFLYVLDETVPVLDRLDGRPSGRVVVGARTGFAFYLDDRRPRKILVGVDLAQSRANTWLDGPFDQLPDNFIKDDSFRDMLIAWQPSLAGKIDRFGNWPGGRERVMIAPYYYYRSTDELAAFDACARDERVKPSDYVTCFVADEAAQARLELVPRAIARLRGPRSRTPKR